jgi:hypothetical protein
LKEMFEVTFYKLTWNSRARLFHQLTCRQRHVCFRNREDYLLRIGFSGVKIRSHIAFKITKAYQCLTVWKVTRKTSYLVTVRSKNGALFRADLNQIGKEQLW